MPIAIEIRWNERDRPHLMQKLNVPIENAAVPGRRRRLPCARIVAKRVSRSKKIYAEGTFLCHLICWAHRDGYVTCVERKRTRSFAAGDAAVVQLSTMDDFLLIVASVAPTAARAMRYHVSKRCFRRIH